MVAAWLLPVNWTTVTPAVLGLAGKGTPTVAEVGLRWLEDERPGPAAMLGQAAQALGEEKAGELRVKLEAKAEAMPEIMRWGGWDPFLEPLTRQVEGEAGSTAVLTFFVTAKARETLAGFLANSRSAGVRAVLATKEVGETGRFARVGRPGGETLEAVILMTALLMQGDHPTATWQRETRAAAERAVVAGELGELEEVYLALLSLGRRLDWVQLGALMGVTEDRVALDGFAGLARREPEAMPEWYAAALLGESTGRVIRYLTEAGDGAKEDLRLALREGQGAVRLLLAKAQPVTRQPLPAPGQWTAFALRRPQEALGLKYLGWWAGVFGLGMGLAAVAREVGERPVRRVRTLGLSAAGAALAVGLLVVVTEPALLKEPSPRPNFALSFVVPVLGTVTDPSSLQETPSSFPMDINTLISITFFAALQVGMYLICVAKIREIEARRLEPLVKLRLMENEENLFDGGLYLGIGGTAAALVLQVLGVIEPNLLAAYSSNLFGITCVALVKIRRVRPYKCALILRGQEALASVGK